MPTATAKQPLRLDEARARRALAQQQADVLFDQEQALRAQVSRAVVPGSTDVERAVTLKQELRRVELAIETVVQSFAALDADVRAADQRARPRPRRSSSRPCSRSCGSRARSSTSRSPGFRRRSDGWKVSSPGSRRWAGRGIATAIETSKALDLLLRDVLRRKLTGEGARSTRSSPETRSPCSSSWQPKRRCGDDW